MSRTKLCPNLSHVWRRVRGGKREECAVCGTSFPCRAIGCGHVDCHQERGEELPSGISEAAPRILYYQPHIPLIVTNSLGRAEHEGNVGSKLEES